MALPLHGTLAWLLKKQTKKQTNKQKTCAATSIRIQKINEVVHQATCYKVVVFLSTNLFGSPKLLQTHQCTTSITISISLHTPKTFTSNFKSSILISLFLTYSHVVEILFDLDIIYLTCEWEYGLISSFSSWKMISHWAYFSTMEARGGRKRLPKFKFSAKFPIGLHVILQIQIQKFENDCYLMWKIILTENPSRFNVEPLLK